MNRFFICILILIALPFYVHAQALNDIGWFQTFKANFTLKEWDETRLKSTVKWNFVYGKPFWSSLSNDLVFSNDIGNITPMIGLFTSYVYQEERSNYVEVRPYLGITFNKFIKPNLSLFNTAKFQSRNFFYLTDIHREEYGRIDNELGGEYFFKRNDIKNTSWSIYSSYEWYFFQAPAFDESYSNSRDFNLKINHYLSNGNLLSFHYVASKFLPGNNMVTDAGQSFTIEYIFN